MRKQTTDWRCENRPPIEDARTNHRSEMRKHTTDWRCENRPSIGDAKTHHRGTQVLHTRTLALEDLYRTVFTHSIKTVFRGKPDLVTLIRLGGSYLVLSKTTLIQGNANLRKVCVRFALSKATQWCKRCKALCSRCHRRGPTSAQRCHRTSFRAM